jgi:hypothetical protein
MIKNKEFAVLECIGYSGMLNILDIIKLYNTFENEKLPESILLEFGNKMDNVYFIAMFNNAPLNLLKDLYIIYPEKIYLNVKVKEKDRSFYSWAFDEEDWESIISYTLCINRKIDNVNEKINFFIEIFSQDPEKLKNNDWGRIFYLTCMTINKLSIDRIMNIIHANPDFAKYKCPDREYPIYVAIHNDAPFKIINELLNIYPDIAKEAIYNRAKGYLLHQILFNRKLASTKLLSYEFMNNLVSLYPDALKKTDVNGVYPLHLLLIYQNINIEEKIKIINLFRKVYPSCIYKKIKIFRNDDRIFYSYCDNKLQYYSEESDNENSDSKENDNKNSDSKENDNENSDFEESNNENSDFEESDNEDKSYHCYHNYGYYTPAQLAGFLCEPFELMKALMP